MHTRHSLPLRRRYRKQPSAMKQKMSKIPAPMVAPAIMPTGRTSAKGGVGSNGKMALSKDQSSFDTLRLCPFTSESKPCHLLAGGGEQQAKRGSTSPISEKPKRNLLAVRIGSSLQTQQHPQRAGGYLELEWAEDCRICTLNPHFRPPPHSWPSLGHKGSRCP